MFVGHSIYLGIELFLTVLLIKIKDDALC